VASSRKVSRSRSLNVSLAGIIFISQTCRARGAGSQIIFDEGDVSTLYAQGTAQRVQSQRTGVVLCGVTMVRIIGGYRIISGR